MKTVLIPIPSTDFDPTEAGVTWKILKDAGIETVFATPHGQIAAGDDRMLTGRGLGIWASLLRANDDALVAYSEMAQSAQFKNPIKWSDARAENFDGLVLPGGHAPGMKEYLESVVLQKLVAKFFESQKLIGAICHGVVLAARSGDGSGKSVLHGRKVTALLRSQEMVAWSMTCLWLGNYYRTYPESVQAEVTRNLASSRDFLAGPNPLKRDSLQNLEYGFVVQDKNLITARWPGDAHLFGKTLVDSLLQS